MRSILGYNLPPITYHLSPTHPPTLPLHRLLLAIFLAGILGTITELVFLEHYEDLWQLLPFAVALAGIAVAAWYATNPRHALRAFRMVLVMFAVSGVVGLALHFKGNLEFAREQDASLGGLRLVWEVVTGATPALAPGMMIFLAAIGYAATRAAERPLASPRS
jgi:hypothetical protein